MQFIYILLIGIIVYYFVTRLFENYSTQEDFDPSLVPVSSIVTLAKVAQKLVDGGGTLTNPGNLTVTGQLIVGSSSNDWSRCIELRAGKKEQPYIDFTNNSGTRNAFIMGNPQEIFISTNLKVSGGATINGQVVTTGGSACFEMHDRSNNANFSTWYNNADNTRLYSNQADGGAKDVLTINKNGNIDTTGGLNVKPAKGSGTYNYFQDTEGAGRLRVGAAWGKPAIYSADANTELSIGSNKGIVNIGDPQQTHILNVYGGVTATGEITSKAVISICDRQRLSDLATNYVIYNDADVFGIWRNSSAGTATGRKLALDNTGTLSVTGGATFGGNVTIAGSTLTGDHIKRLNEIIYWYDKVKKHIYVKNNPIAEGGPEQVVIDLYRAGWERLNCGNGGNAINGRYNVGCNGLGFEKDGQL